MTELDKDALDAAARAIAGGGSLRDAIRAYLAVADDWRPIETAQSGESVIVYAGGVVGEAYYLEDEPAIGWWWANTTYGDYYAETLESSGHIPTHWRPLPSPPKEGGMMLTEAQREVLRAMASVITPAGRAALEGE